MELLWQLTRQLSGIHSQQPGSAAPLFSLECKLEHQKPGLLAVKRLIEECLLFLKTTYIHSLVTASGEAGCTFPASPMTCPDRWDASLHADLSLTLWSAPRAECSQLFVPGLQTAWDAHSKAFCASFLPYQQKYHSSTASSTQGPKNHRPIQHRPRSKAGSSISNCPREAANLIAVLAYMERKSSPATAAPILLSWHCSTRWVLRQSLPGESSGRWFKASVTTPAIDGTFPYCPLAKPSTHLFWIQGKPQQVGQSTASTALIWVSPALKGWVAGASQHSGDLWWEH